MSYEVKDANVLKETESAILIEAPEFDEQEWIPKSVITEDSEVRDEQDNANGTLIVEDWFATKRHWQ